jgi:hypothetical protein
VTQLAGGELGKRPGAVGLGDIVQQGDKQLVGVGVLLVEPGAGTGSRLRLAQRMALGHGGSFAYRPYLVRSCSALARQAAASSGKPVLSALADRPS